jgi:glycosyltransferase involved in cell wall biosynthesis
MPDDLLKYSSTTVSRTGITNHFIPPFNHFRPHKLSYFLEYAWFLKQNNSRNFDLVHSAYYNLSKASFDLIKKGTPHIITVHDLIHELFELPNDQLIKTRSQILKSAKAIIVVSENTKQDLIRVYQSIDESKIHVIHHGIEASTRRPPISLDKNFYSKFILYVGHREGYKNFKLILPVIKKLNRSYNIQLIVVGSQFTNQERATIAKYEVESKVTNLGLISDDYLDMLYSQCLAFVYTSIYEGFGYPLIEAMRCGAIPIALNVSCIPEVLGSAGILVEPNCNHSIVKQIEKLIEEKDYRKKLKNKSLNRTQNFNIVEQIRKTKYVYELITS